MVNQNSEKKWLVFLVVLVVLVLVVEILSLNVLYQLAKAGSTSTLGGELATHSARDACIEGCDECIAYCETYVLSPNCDEYCGGYWKPNYSGSGGGGYVSCESNCRRTYSD